MNRMNKVGSMRTPAELVDALLVAMAAYDAAALEPLLTDDVVWWSPPSASRFGVPRPIVGKDESFVCSPAGWASIEPARSPGRCSNSSPTTPTSPSGSLGAVSPPWASRYREPVLLHAAPRRRPHRRRLGVHRHRVRVRAVRLTARSEVSPSGEPRPRFLGECAQDRSGLEAFLGLPKGDAMKSVTPTSR